MNLAAGNYWSSDVKIERRFLQHRFSNADVIAIRGEVSDPLSFINAMASYFQDDDRARERLWPAWNCTFSSPLG